MKIYNSVTIDIKSGETLHEDYFEYDGEVAKTLGGGGSESSDTYDPVYNAGLLKIQQEQQGIAKEYFDYWEKDQKPLEQKQIAANTELLPYQTEGAKETLAFESLQRDEAGRLLPAQTDYALAKYENDLALMPQRTETARLAMGGANELMNQANVNTGDWVGQYQADASQGFAGSESDLRRKLAAQGISQGSAQYQKAMNDLTFQKSKAVGGARVMGRRAADTEKFNRTTAATSAANSAWRE